VGHTRFVPHSSLGIMIPFKNFGLVDGLRQLP